MANIYITQELFENIILSMLEDMGCKTEIIEVPDNSESTRLLVKKGEKNVGGKTVMAIELDSLYEGFMKYHPLLQEIVNFIHNTFEENKIVAPEYKHWTESWDEVKDRLYFSIHNRNDPSIQGAVWKEVDDLVLVARVYVESSSSGILSLIVKKDLLEKWNVSEEEVIQTAKKNAPKLFPVKINSADGFMKEAARNFGGNPKEISELSADCPPMIIVTTEKGAHGAAALFYDHVLETLSEMIGDTFFIIPSSINEFFILPKEYISFADDISRIIEETNHNLNAISAKEVLSNHGYIFRDGKFSSCV